MSESRQEKTDIEDSTTTKLGGKPYVTVYPIGLPPLKETVVWDSMPENGTLYVLATPIGNLGDLSSRAAMTLGSVSLVAAEDTRRTLKLLSHLELRVPLIRCDERLELKAAEKVLQELRSGQSVALVSDAGTPALSDPGCRLVQRVRTEGFAVVPIPGPSAIATALSVAGFPVVPFRFAGFLERKSAARLRQMRSMLASPETTAFFESPFRVQRTLQELASLEPGRQACLARELTKIHEEIVTGDLQTLSQIFSKRVPKGEFTLIIGPRSKAEIRQARRNTSTLSEE